MALRVAIIGSGWGVRIQVPAFRTNGIQVNAIWCRTEEKAKQIATDLNVPFASSDYQSVIDRPDVDLVSIVTPTSTHLELSNLALKAGKHVLCEKPTAMDTKQAEEMLLLAKAHPKQITLIDHELRFLPSYSKMRELVQAGAIGEIYYIEANNYGGGRLGNREWSWWSSKDFGGGILGAVGSHLIDISSWVLNRKIESVNGILNTFIKERPDPETKQMKEVTSDDFFSFHGRFSGGVIGKFSSAVIRAGTNSSELTIAGSKGRLTWENGKVTLYGLTTSSTQIKPEIVEDDEKHRDPESPLKDPWGQGTVLIGKALKEAILENKLESLSPAATFEDGLYTQKVMDAVRKSSDEGKWVNI